MTPGSYSKQPLNKHSVQYNRHTKPNKSFVLIDKTEDISRNISPASQSSCHKQDSKTQSRPEPTSKKDSTRWSDMKPSEQIQTPFHSGKQQLEVHTELLANKDDMPDLRKLH